MVTGYHVPCGCLSDLYDVTDAIALYMLAAPDFLTFINEFEKCTKPSQLLRCTSQRISKALERHFVIDIASFMRVLIDHVSPFLDAVHVVIDTGNVMGAWTYS